MGDDRVYITDVLDIIEAMEQTSYFNNQPPTTPQTCINYAVNHDRHFADMKEFIYTSTFYKEEALRQCPLREVLSTGDHFCRELYSWRSLAQKLPSSVLNSVNIQDQVSVYDFMKPHINKLADLTVFVKNSIDSLQVELRTISCHFSGFSGPSSSEHLYFVGKIFCLLYKLNFLKDKNSYISTDFSIFKRCLLSIDSRSVEEVVADSREIMIFFAEVNSIWNNLAAIIYKIDNILHVLVKILNVYVEKSSLGYVSPTRQQNDVLTLSAILSLIDGLTPSSKLDSKKVINLAKIDAMFHENPHVAVMGDVVVTIFEFVCSSPKFDSSRWPLSSGESKIPVNLDKLRTHCDFLNKKLTLISLEHNGRPATVNTSTQLSYFLRITHTVYKSLKFLCQIRATCQNLYLHKLTHPTAGHQHSHLYEKVLRYNLTPNELDLLTELIRISKSLHVKMESIKSLISEAISGYTYHATQSLCAAVDRVLGKKGTLSSSVKNVARGLVDACNDFSTDYVRKVPPSSSQLHILLISCRELADKKEFRRLLRKEMTHGEYDDLFTEIQCWPDLIDFESALSDCCSFSSFLLRESHLSVRQGKESQFPLNNSLIWILIDHVLTTKTRFDSLLCLLDVYNDAAADCLLLFKKQQMFSELESEADVCLNLMVFRLARVLYGNFKEQSAYILLNKTFRNKILDACSVLPPEHIQTDFLGQTKNFKFIGRDVSLCSLLTSHFNSLFGETLDELILRLENGDLTKIKEFDMLLRLNRIAHDKISKSFPLVSFDLCLARAQCSLISYVSRHVPNEIIPDYTFHLACFRFDRAQNGRNKYKISKPFHHWGSKTFNTLFSYICRQWEDFLSLQHLGIIYRLCGADLCASVSRGLLKYVPEWIENIFGLCRRIYQHIPHSFAINDKIKSLPINAVANFIGQHFQSLIDQASLWQEFLRDLRKVGNCLGFLLLWEKSVKFENLLESDLGEDFGGNDPRGIFCAGMMGELCGLSGSSAAIELAVLKRVWDTVTLLCHLDDVELCDGTVLGGAALLVAVNGGQLALADVSCHVLPEDSSNVNNVFIQRMSKFQRQFSSCMSVLDEILVDCVNCCNK